MHDDLAVGAVGLGKTASCRFCDFISTQSHDSDGDFSCTIVDDMGPVAIEHIYISHERAGNVASGYCCGMVGHPLVCALGLGDAQRRCGLVDVGWNDNHTVSNTLQSATADARNCSVTQEMGDGGCYRVLIAPGVKLGWPVWLVPGLVICYDWVWVGRFRATRS